MKKEGEDSLLDSLVGCGDLRQKTERGSRQGRDSPLA